MHRRALLIVVVLLVSSAPVLAQRDRLSIEQFLDWEYVASPQISPDGKQIVYTKHWPDKINDKYEDEIWIMDADGGPAFWSRDRKRTGRLMASGWLMSPLVSLRVRRSLLSGSICLVSLS